MSRKNTFRDAARETLNIRTFKNVRDFCRSQAQGSDLHTHLVAKAHFYEMQAFAILLDHSLFAREFANGGPPSIGIETDEPHNRTVLKKGPYEITLLYDPRNSKIDITTNETEKRKLPWRDMCRMLERENQAIFRDAKLEEGNYVVACPAYQQGRTGMLMEASRVLSPHVSELVDLNMVCMAQLRRTIIEVLCETHGIKPKGIAVHANPPSVHVPKRPFEKLRRDEQITDISFNPSQN